MQQVEAKQVENVLANHPKAEFAGGRRKSLGRTDVLRKKSGDDESQDEESESRDLIHQGEQDNNILKRQLQQQQEQERYQHKYANADRKARQFNPVTNNHIRQPGQFTKGVPKEFKAIAKEMKP
ncbi:hypothetical protein IWW36_003154 [Coemansia brasiliensis]|uniref:Uncharacterized protein n=1 Tax=Coemansia brasiliensis TaxID=2650707 RepID=A0A9W8LZ90_9FUNG|nr:hypothetical protein IWW36_003154 [Coemansia brasiliensis]